MKGDRDDLVPGSVAQGVEGLGSGLGVGSF